VARIPLRLLVALGAILGAVILTFLLFAATALDH
jgi:hypothetical protein